MQNNTYTILSNRALTENVWEMKLQGDMSWDARPGQFVNFQLSGLYLRRPISVCNAETHGFTVIYKVVGRGTQQMSRMRPGQALDALVGLGNGYDLRLAGENPLLLGGGVGIPPLFFLARRLLDEGRHVQVILGFNTGKEVFYADEFRALGASVIVTTADGSLGRKGFVTDALPETYSHFYTCGPEPMLKAVYARTNTDGQFSFEARMGCGFGACMGCSCKTITGYKRICKDGPVLRKGEILWEK